jgi:hypothetical protein
VIAIVILSKLMHFVVLAKVAIVAIFPNVATVGIEKSVATPTIRELDTAVLSLRHGGLGLQDWFQCHHRKKQSDECEDRLRIKVNAHVSASKFPQIAERRLAILVNVVVVVCAVLNILGNRPNADRVIYSAAYLSTPDKRGGLNGSAQHQVEVCLHEFQEPRSFPRGDSNRTLPFQGLIGYGQAHRFSGRNTVVSAG